ncbi:MAG: (Fe-S)-binding protein [bacterium]
MNIEKTEIFRSVCNHSSPFVNAAVHLDVDLSSLLPYLNATQDKTQYYLNIPYLKFNWQGHRVVIEKNSVRIYGFDDDEAARAAAGKVIDAIRKVEAEKESITPDNTPYHPPSAIAVLSLLPKKTGCGQCCYSTCMAFALALLEGDTEIGACKPLFDEPALSDNVKKLECLL